MPSWSSLLRQGSRAENPMTNGWKPDQIRCAGRITAEVISSSQAFTLRMIRTARREERIVSAKVGGQPLEKDRLYTIATNNFVALGEGLCLSERCAGMQPVRRLRRGGHPFCEAGTGEGGSGGDSSVDGGRSRHRCHGARNGRGIRPAAFRPGLSGSGVDTGDAADLTLHVLLLAASCGCIAIIWRRRRSGADR